MTVREFLEQYDLDFEIEDEFRDEELQSNIYEIAVSELARIADKLEATPSELMKELYY